MRRIQAEILELKSLVMSKIWQNKNSLEGLNIRITTLENKMSELKCEVNNTPYNIRRLKKA